MPKIDQNLIRIENLIKGDFFDLAGLNDLTDKEKETLMVKMLEAVKNRVLLRLDRETADRNRAKFEELLDEGNEKKISYFIKEQGINVEKMVAEEAILLKKEIVEKIGASNS